METTNEDLPKRKNLSEETKPKLLGYSIETWLIAAGVVLAIPLLNMLALPVILVLFAPALLIYFWRLRRSY